LSVQLEGTNDTKLLSDNNDGIYVASIVPHQVGKVKVAVCVNGEHIKGSPYSVVVGRNYTSLSVPSKILAIGKQSYVGSIAFSRSGIWAIADLKNRCIKLYDNEDQLIRTFDVRKSDHFQTHVHAYLITFDDDYLYVAYWYMIQKFTIGGEYLLKFATGSDYDNHFRGLTAHNGKVYATNNAQCVSVFLTDGTMCQTIGREHSDWLVYNRTFAQYVRGFAHDVAVTSNDELLVVDHNHNCVYKFTMDGDYMGKFTQFDGLIYPRCIAIDPHGYIFVVDNCQVVIFDKDGNFVHSLRCPARGIAINKNGDIYLISQIRHNDCQKIQVFSNY